MNASIIASVHWTYSLRGSPVSCLLREALATVTGACQADGPGMGLASPTVQAVLTMAHLIARPNGGPGTEPV